MLIQIRKWAITPYVIIPLMLLVLSLSFNGFAASSPKANIKKSYTGMELFKGIVLGQGEVAAMLPYTPQQNQASANVQTEKEALCNEVLNDIASTNPGYFEDFAAAIYSKNHYQIEQAIKEGAALAIKAGVVSEKFGKQFSAQTGIAREDLGKFNLNTKEGLKSFEQYAADKMNNDTDKEKLRNMKGTCAAVVVVVVVVAVVAIAVAVAFSQEEQQTERQLSANSLLREKLVAQIAEL